jgi:hypothetical protein
MPGKKVTFESVREIGLGLPDVEEGTMYGSPALKLGGRLLACMAVHKSAEPESLVVRTDFEERAALLAEEPETYYLTDHYVNHPVVLVRLSRIRVDQLRDLLGSAWRFVTAHASQKAARRPVKRGGKRQEKADSRGGKRGA